MKIIMESGNKEYLKSRAIELIKESQRYETEVMASGETTIETAIKLLALVLALGD